MQTPKHMKYLFMYRGVLQVSPAQAGNEKVFVSLQRINSDSYDFKRHQERT